MRIKLLFILAFFTTVISSCKHEEEPDINFIEIIYCTPDNPGKCLPLEITNSADGWQAKYIGSLSGGLISLKPRYSLDKSGNTLIVFDEYLEGKKQGYYSFGKIQRKDNDFPHEMSYYRTSGKKVMTFSATIVCKNDLFIGKKDIPEAIKTISSYYELYNFDYNTNQRDLNIIHLIHSNPNTLTYPFDKCGLFETSTSPNSLLRTYRYHSGGGNHFTANYDVSILQYKTGDTMMVLDNFSWLLFQRLRKDSADAVWPICFNLEVDQATSGSHTYYLIEAAFVAYSEDQYFTVTSEESIALFAFSIENGKLTPANIFAGKSIIELNGLSTNDDIHFKYDDKKKELRVPVLDKNDNKFTGKYEVIKIKEE